MKKTEMKWDKLNKCFSWTCRRFIDILATVKTPSKSALKKHATEKNTTIKWKFKCQKLLWDRWIWEHQQLGSAGSSDSISYLRHHCDIEGLAQLASDWWGCLCVHTDLPGHHGNHPTETRPPEAQPIAASLRSPSQWDSSNAEVWGLWANQSQCVGVSLAEGRFACSVASDVAGRGGACQCRIHSGEAIDLDSFSPGGEAREGEGQRGDAGKHILYSGGRGKRGSNRCRGKSWVGREEDVLEGWFQWWNRSKCPPS